MVWGGAHFIIREADRSKPFHTSIFPQSFDVATFIGRHI